MSVTTTLCSKKKPGTHITTINFHKHRPISMPLDRIVLATLLDNLQQSTSCNCYHGNQRTRADQCLCYYSPSCTCHRRVCVKPHLIWFLPTSGHLIAPTLWLITEFGTVFNTQVYQNRKGNINELKQHLVDVWSDFGQTVIDGAIDEWRKRLQACVRMKGHHLEHVL